MASDQSWNVDDLVMRSETATSAETKLLAGAALLAASFYWRSGEPVTLRVMQMAGGVLIAGAVRDMFWPSYRELTAEQRKDLTAQIME